MTRADTRRAFTLVELLVVIAIIMLLASLLIVSLGAATRRAQRGNTAALLTAVAQALTRFKADTGYLPPVLGDPRSLSTGSGNVLGWGSATSFSTGPAPNVVSNFMPAGQVGWLRDLLPPPTKVVNGTAGLTKVAQWSSAEAKALQRWHSVTSLAEYLIGPGDRSQDGYGICGTMPDSMPAAPKPGQREVPREGIRHPGADGVWGAALTPVLPAEVSAAGAAGNYTGAKFGVGTFASRNLALPSRIAASATPSEKGNDDVQCMLRTQQNLKGRSLGPYLELKDPGSLGGIRGTRLSGSSDVTYDVVRATEADPNFDLYPKCILDYWGSPIRYYRRGYLNLTPTTPNRASDGTQFDLGDFFALRPVSGAEADFLDPAEAAREALDDENPLMPMDANMNGRDRSSTRRLRSAEFALLSAGPDRRVDLSRRVSIVGRDNLNEDNIVETGP